jgi:hypothetical protein
VLALFDALVDILTGGERKHSQGTNLGAYPSLNGQERSAVRGRFGRISWNRADTCPPGISRRQGCGQLKRHSTPGDTPKRRRDNASAIRPLLR